MQLLSVLQARFLVGGEKDQKAYEDHTEWCEERNIDAGAETKAGRPQASASSSEIDEPSTWDGLTNRSHAP